MLRAITATPSDGDYDEEIQRAIRHSERALYEAYDGAIFFLLVEFQKFKEDYRNVVVSEIIDNFIELEQTMKRAKQFLERARTQSVERADYYQEIQEIYPSIVSVVETLDAARDELNKKRVKSRRFWVTPAAILTSGILGAIACKVFG